LIKENIFYLKFLRPGSHNLTFELREQSTTSSIDNPCWNEDKLVLDRILKNIVINV
jgi:hypothetical protein